ncbi:MAG: hypothetical protein WC788_00465 [Candidatus Paceibacterota bacterium]|jgi:division protein CdvB (Snf7/Vps24/ESCRT-III family)
MGFNPFEKIKNFVDGNLKKITPEARSEEDEIDEEIDEKTMQKLREDCHAPDDEILKREERYRREEELKKTREKIKEVKG